jgi:hypothetical protein
MGWKTKKVADYGKSSATIEITQANFKTLRLRRGQTRCGVWHF